MATLIKVGCFRHTGYSIPLLLYFLVMHLSGALSGYRGVIIAIIAIAIFIFAWLIPVTKGHYNLVELLLFLIESIAVSWLFRWNERVMKKLDDSERKYRRIIEV